MALNESRIPYHMKLHPTISRATQIIRSTSSDTGP